MTEDWRPIQGSNARYEVSNQGRIANVRRTRNGAFYRILKPINDGHGYRRVKIPAFGLPRRLWFVHQLVMLAFVGDCPKGHCVNHIDSNRANNRLDNLEYVTPTENQRHSWRTTARKAAHQGERTHFAKLSESDVKQIRALRQTGMPYSHIAARFNTKQANVWFICSGRTWKHLL